MMNDLHVLDLIPAYVLGSLDEDESRQVAEHLAGCYLCRSELEAYQQVADGLLLALPPEVPSTALKSQLIDRVQRLNQKPIPELREPRRVQAPRRLVPAGAWIGLALILLLAVSNLVLWNRMNNMEFMTGPLGMRAIPLENTDQAPKASGFVIIGADGKNGVLVVDKLASLPENQEYQVWLQHDSTETSAGLFSVDEDGYRGLRIVAPQSLLTYSSVQVTIEPKGGSANPTGPQMLTGSLFNP